MYMFQSLNVLSVRLVLWPLCRACGVALLLDGLRSGLSALVVCALTVTRRAVTADGDALSDAWHVRDADGVMA
jgi:hypothetical protein